MRRGRPPKRADHADHVEGSQLSRKRLKAILQTLGGEKTVEEACEELGITEAHFHRLRQKALEAAAAALEPRQAGRPPKVSEASVAQVEELEAELAEAKIELRASEVREELAMLMPHVLAVGEESEEKKRKRNRRWRAKKK